MSDDELREQRLSELAHEFSNRARQGELNSVDEFASAHPELAAEIRELFPPLLALETQSAATFVTSCPIPACLGDFSIVRKIGQGGMGQVFEAVQEPLNRRVALKVLSVQASTEGALRRFSREAQIVARLHHTNIVPIYAFGSTNGVLYFAMQFIDGWSLNRILEQQNSDVANQCGFSRDPRSVARLGIETASALSAAHACGVIHRDVKPGNILLDRNHKLWLTDFGLAQMQDTDNLTGPNDMLGTMRYMPPERLSGMSGELGDVYGLGITLYEVLAGRPAFNSKDTRQLVGQILNESPPDIRSINAAVPRDLATIIHKCMAKMPGERYQSAQALEEDLALFCADCPIQARRTSAINSVWLWAKRNRVLACTLATAAMALTAVAILSTLLLFRENAYRRSLEVAIRDTDSARQNEIAEMYSSLVESSRSKQSSFRPGQRFGSIEDLRLAKQLLDERWILPESEKQLLTAELRDLAVSALALIDVRQTATLKHTTYSYTDLYRGDRFFFQRDKVTAVCRNFDNQDLFSLPAVDEDTIVLATPDKNEVLLIDRMNQRLSRRRIDHSISESVAESADFLHKYHVAEFSKDGRVLLLWSYGETRDSNAVAAIYNWATGKQLFRIDGLAIDSLAHLSPDGSKVVLKFGDYGSRESKELRVIDVTSGEGWLLHTFNETIQSTAWYRDSRSIAVGLAESNIIEWWDVLNRRMLQRNKSQHGGGPHLASSPTGQWLYSYSGWTGQSMFWPSFSDQPGLVATGFPDFAYPTGPGHFMGSRSIDESTNEVWEAVPSPVVRVLSRHPIHGDVNRWLGTAVHPSGRILAVGSDNGISLFDLVTAQEIYCLEVGQCNYPFFVPKTGELLANSRSGLHRWEIECDSQTGELVKVSQPEILCMESRFGMQVASDHSGKLIANACGDRVFLIHDSGRKIDSIFGLGDCRFVAVSPNGKWLATSTHGGSPGEYLIWDTSTLRLVKAMPRGEWSGLVRFSADGKWLSLGHSSPNVLSTETWEVENSMNQLSGAQYVFSADNRLVLSELNGRIALQDTSTAERICFLTCPANAVVNHWEFSPDGNYAILTSNQELSTYVWDLQSLKKEGSSEELVGQ
ncbi:MAG: WD40 repeat domain-containing serine/threonine protein kinase [bacterium]|nr:WD40 repeat domain-containing serine/threonine protein kinase [bacterium]